MERTTLDAAERRLDREGPSGDAFDLSPAGHHDIRVTVRSEHGMTFAYTVRVSRRAGAVEVARVVLAGYRRVLSRGPSPYFRGGEVEGAR